MQTAQLIPVFTGTIHSEPSQLVDARELHRFLEIDTHFKDWIARRIAEYGFAEGDDYILVAQNRATKGRGGDRRSKDYHITLDMGKELAMVERNDKGRQARRYFIECEKRLQQIAPDDARTIMNETIGTDGFHMLGALIRGKVAALPVEVRRRATAKIWSQTHAAFGVRSATDIPANQLDAARNFVAAYSVHEGEWLPKPEKRCGTMLNDHQLYDVYFVCHHFQYLYEIFKRHSLYSFLEQHGSRAGVEMIDHFKDGYMGVWKLRKDFEGEFDAVQRRLRLNRYSEHSIR